MATIAATLAETNDGRCVVLAAAGEWLVATAAELDRRLRAIEIPEGSQGDARLGGDRPD